MIDRDKQCGACQNMDAYWEERARHDPHLRERLLQLQRQKQVVPAGAPAQTEEQSDCAEECLED